MKQYICIPRVSWPVYLSVRMPVLVCSCLSACLCVCMFALFCMQVCMPVCLSVCLTDCLVCLSACLPVPVSLCQTRRGMQGMYATGHTGRGGHCHRDNAAAAAKQSDRQIHTRRKRDTTRRQQLADYLQTLSQTHTKIDMRGEGRGVCDIDMRHQRHKGRDTCTDSERQLLSPSDRLYSTSRTAVSKACLGWT